MLIDIFESIPDHRVVGRCTYPLSELLTIALLTYLCGGEDYVDMSEFAYVRARDFGLLAGCPGRSPSPDTFERLMSSVAPEELERCLVENGRRFLDSLTEKQIAIDGKKLRGTSPKSNGTKGDYLMNAFVSENSIVIGQERLTDKENEISAIPRLLERLDITNAVVSIDAIGTQVEIADQIIKGHGNYFLAVKDNQPALSECGCPVVTQRNNEIKSLNLHLHLRSTGLSELASDTLSETLQKNGRITPNQHTSDRNFGRM